MNTDKVTGAILGAMTGILIFLGAADAENGKGKADDKTLSPYFVVKGGDTTVDSLPLKSTSADVRISGVIAEVKVTQIYRNEGRKPLEALYVFPASTRAAVHAMSMKVGERTITAEIRERKKAREEYEAAKMEGKTASLLTEERPNVFTMNLANILPGDEIVVELRYSEFLPPTDGRYEFVYPTVVGPRYSNKSRESASARDQFVETPYEHEKTPPSYDWDIAVILDAGMPLAEVTSPSHKIEVTHDEIGRADVRLDSSERRGGNRDFILRYSMAGNEVQSGLILQESEGEKFFLMMLEPPREIRPPEIPPREYIFIVDVSGSMNGFPLAVSQKFLRNLVVNLRPVDSLNVLLFAGGSALWSPQSRPATPENAEAAARFISDAHAGGGTEILPALKRAMALPRVEGVSRTVIVVTDGYIDVEREAFDMIRKNLDSTNVFAFGIGTGVNRYLIEGLARAGMGEPFVVESPEAAGPVAERFRKYISSPVLTNIKAAFKGFEAYDVSPPALPDLFAARPVILFGKWKGPAEGRIEVSGRRGKKDWKGVIDVAKADRNDQNEALRYLWARSEIARLSDYASSHEEENLVKRVTKLGLDYNLLTPYTSFIAIDHVVRRTDTGFITVKTALPLPVGVSDMAIGYGFEIEPLVKIIRRGTQAAGPRGVSVLMALLGGAGLLAMTVSIKGRG